MLAADWDTVIKRALAKKPEQRFQTARQFSDAIRFVAEGRALPKAPEFLNDATVQVPPSPKAEPAAPARQSRSWIYPIVGAVAAAAAAAGTAVYVMRPQPPAPVAAPAPVAKPAPVVAAAPTPPPAAVEAPKPAPVAEEAKPAPVAEAPPAPPPVKKEKVKERLEKKIARQEERKRRIEESPPPAPVKVVSAAPSFRAKVVSLDRSWGFAVVELAERGSVKVGDRLTATVSSGRRVDMVVRRVSGNLASAVPDGRLSDDLVGASVTRN
jgi:hypothetical protein